jgi:hypothetical protein
LWRTQSPNSEGGTEIPKGKQKPRDYEPLIFYGFLAISIAFAFLMYLAITFPSLSQIREYAIAISSIVLGFSVAEAYTERVPRAKENRKRRTEKEEAERLQAELKREAEQRQSELLAKNKEQLAELEAISGQNQLLQKQLRDAEDNVVRIREAQHSELIRKAGSAAELGLYLTQYWVRILEASPRSEPQAGPVHLARDYKRLSLSLAMDLGLQAEVDSLLEGIERNNPLGFDRGEIHVSANELLAKVSTRFGGVAYTAMALQLNLYESSLKGGAYLDKKMLEVMLQRCEVNESVVNYCANWVKLWQDGKCSRKESAIFIWALLYYIADHLGGRDTILVRLIEEVQPAVGSPNFARNYLEAIEREPPIESVPGRGLIDEVIFRKNAWSLAEMMDRKMVRLLGVPLEESIEQISNAIRALAQFLNVSEEAAGFVSIDEKADKTESMKIFNETHDRIHDALVHRFPRVQGAKDSVVADCFELSYNLVMAGVHKDNVAAENLKPLLEILGMGPESIDYVTRSIKEFMRAPSQAVWAFTNNLKVYLTGAAMTSADLNYVKNIFEKTRPPPKYFESIKWDATHSFSSEEQ